MSDESQSANGGNRKRRRRRRRRRDKKKNTSSQDVLVVEEGDGGGGGGSRNRGRRQSVDVSGPAVSVPSSGRNPHRKRNSRSRRGAPGSAMARRRRLSRSEIDDLAGWLERMPEALVASLYKDSLFDELLHRRISQRLERQRYGCAFGSEDHLVEPKFP